LAAGTVGTVRASHFHTASLVAQQSAELGVQALGSVTLHQLPASPGAHGGGLGFRPAYPFVFAISTAGGTAVPLHDALGCPG